MIAALLESQQNPKKLEERFIVMTTKEKRDCNVC